MVDAQTLREQKRELRALMRARRAEAYKQNPDAPAWLRDRFLKAIVLPDNGIVSSYVAHDSEMDPMPLMQALHARGHKLCLPFTADKGKALLFHAYTPGDELTVQGPLAIPAPPPDKPQLAPDIVLVPLLAFDSQGHRLGYGGGYYDRTLAALRAQKSITAIGIAFACQQVPEIPFGPHDARLDKIVTENEFFSV
jgi:5-formyltetrahydrofolate cyclo-ligase